MPDPKILWLTHPAHARSVEGWSSVLTGYDLIQVSAIGAVSDVLVGDSVDCVLVTGGIDSYSAVDVMRDIQRVAPRVSVVFSDQQITAGEAVELVRRGAAHCFCQHDPWEATEQAVEKAVEESRRRRRLTRNARSVCERWLVGGGRAMDLVYETIALVGPRKCTVLITGETGTGKEMAAQALHHASPRAQEPMISVNCSALPENLLEAELFGHVKGAFTGAVGGRIGRFEQANQGTIFLDEIGEMPLELQAKLLRVLQERELQRLGSSTTVKLDVRVIAATNASLLERVKNGRFREDLYYRLNVVPLRMPPLRERPEDIPLLIDHFVGKICRAEGLSLKTVTLDAKERLAEMPWPGNVRQLENLVEATIALSGDRETLTFQQFGGMPAGITRFPQTPMCLEPVIQPTVNFETAVSHFERGLLENALQKTRGNKTAAAEMLGMKRTTLIMKLRSWKPPVALPPAV
jgi:DNA-binding NtrC family response regulator